MNFDRFTYPDLKIPAAIFCGLWLAVVLGLLAGNGDFDKLKLVTAVVIVLVFILFFLRFAWVVGLLICFCAFYQVGFGFTISELEMSLVLGAVVFAVTWWRKERIERPPVFDQWSFGLLNTLLILWLAYVASHTIFNIYNPYRPADYALKNLLKTVEGWTGPLLLILYFANRPQHIIVQKDFPRRIAWCLLFALSINICIRLFQQLSGADDAVADPNDPMAGNYFTIPVLDLMENVFALRTIPPTAMLFCGAIIVTKWFKAEPPRSRRLFYIVMALSIFGSILSGGRGTLAFVLGLFALFLVIQRRIGLLLGFFAVATVLVGAVNVMPGALKSAPPLIRRSLNWALIEKDVAVSEGISGSSEWRLTLFRRALDEWQSDPRIYWFGRATYSYGLEDVIAVSISGGDASLESSLRRGATHNMLTDLLVIFGLFGLILYLSLYLVFLYCLWRLYRSPLLDELSRTLTLVILISLTFNLIYSLLGGGNFPSVMAWLYIVLVARIYRVHAETLRAQPATKIEPPKARRFNMPAPGGALPRGI